MLYLSTRGHADRKRFCDILLEGLAPDGGLYLPEHYPQIDAARLGELRSIYKEQGYAALAFEILSLYIDDIPAEDLRALCAKTYTQQVFGTAEITPLRPLEDGLWLEALSNGPTLAFKDMAMQLLGNLFEYELGRRGEELNILGATSGDTGSAAEYAMRGKKGVRVFMTSPRGRMSPFQQAQMFSLQDANIHNIAIEGVFDDCQDIVKAVSNDHAFKAKYKLGIALRAFGAAHGVAVHGTVVLGRHLQRRDGIGQQHTAIGIEAVHGVIAGQRQGLGQQFGQRFVKGLERGSHGVFLISREAWGTVAQLLRMLQQPLQYLPWRIEIEHGLARRLWQALRCVGGNGQHMGVVRIQGRLGLAGAGALGLIAPDLYLGQVGVLEAFDQHPVHARIEFGQHVVHRQLRGTGEFAHQRQTAIRGQHHFIGARLAVAPAVLALVIDIEMVVGMLDHRNAEPLRTHQRDQGLHQAGLARAGVAGEADDLHRHALLLRTFGQPGCRISRNAGRYRP